MRLSGVMSVSARPESPVDEQMDLIRRQQRAVWQVLALIAGVEILLAGWLIGMMPH